jgi:hypothetical protein
MRVNAVLFGIVTVAFLANSCLAQEAHTVKMVGDQVALKTPKGWSQYAWRGATAVELTRSHKTAKGTVSDAHIVVFTEKRRDHDEAVARLGEIAAESKTPSKFFLIDGWPALQRSQTVTVPLPGGVDGDAGVPERKVVKVTTAIAANDIVVRSEGSVPVDVKESIVTEVEKMGRDFRFAARPNVSKSKEHVRRLSSIAKRPEAAAAPPVLPMRIKPDRSHTPPGAPSPAAGRQNGELEVAASKDGLHVVVAAQLARTLFSDDGGLTFKDSAATLPPMLGNNGDPSIALGASGAFYVSFLTTPGGACAASVMSSAPNNGAAFTFDANAVLCPAAGDPRCFPDQEHIAADPVGSSTGNDQIYLVYRHFTPRVALGGNCQVWDSYPPYPDITCSADNGKTWMSSTPIADGDDAHVTVGGDEFVWVVQRAGGAIVVSKFSSCETGLQPQPGFPKNVVSVSDPMCPVIGLDRCYGDALSSATIAVDQTDPKHIYIAYANSTGNTNDDILVTDTTDAFATAPNNLRTVTVSGAAIGRRYMPWMCTLGASAQVAWYDRRAGAVATAASVDLTDYFRGSASVAGGTLASGAEVNVSGVSDAQCAPGFGCGARSADLVNSCPRPHNDGRCLNSGGTGSKTPCDRDLNVCPAGEACVANGNPPDTGCPKYGDYNGTACAAGHVFAAWASATAPSGLPPPKGIGLFVDALNCGGPSQACCLSGSNCQAGLTCNATSVCAAPDCGGVGQACCGGSSCAAGSACTAGTCAACPMPARTIIDTTAHNGSDCGGTSHDYVLGQATCDPGFVLGTCSATLSSQANGSTCSASPIPGGCNCKVHVTTPNDCSKWATCRVIVTETPPGGIPTGCPAP